MFHCEQDLLVNLIVLSPKDARKKFRNYIFESWNWECAYCGKKLTPDTATIDHILQNTKVVTTSDPTWHAVAVIAIEQRALFS